MTTEIEMALQFLAILAAGGLTGVLGYAAKRIKYGMPFDSRKFAATALIAALVGIGSLISGRTYSDVVSFAEPLGLTALAYRAIDSTYDHFRNGGFDRLLEKLHLIRT